MDPYYSLERLNNLVESSVVLRLMRTKNLPVILSFLHREFKVNAVISVPYNQLVDKLAYYLEEINFTEDEEVGLDSLLEDYNDRAKKYLNHWIEAHFLRNIIDDATKQPQVLLSKHTEKVFQFLELIKQKEFVGTESRFKDIFIKLRDIIENANPDAEKRLRDLEDKKRAIEEEIRRIKIDGYVGTYEDFQIKSRFEDVNRLANELIGDFKEVEDNFKEITRRIYEKQQKEAMSKGKLLEETFDALYELRNTDQGRSFYAFWHFMLDDASQDELKRLTAEVYEVLEERDIINTSQSLRKIKSLLHSAARKVLDKNGMLADKLSREIIAKDRLEVRKTRELFSAIRSIAIDMTGKELSKSIFLTLQGDPEVFMPMERKLGEKQHSNAFSTTMGKASISMEELQDMSMLYGDLIEKKTLERQIQEALKNREQISLKELVMIYPLNKGLAELLAYISLMAENKRYFFNEKVREMILFDPNEHKYLDVPQIIFSK